MAEYDGREAHPGTAPDHHRVLCYGPFRERDGKEEREREKEKEMEMERSVRVGFTVMGYQWYRLWIRD